MWQSVVCGSAALGSGCGVRGAQAEALSLPAAARSRLVDVSWAVVDRLGLTPEDYCWRFQEGTFLPLDFLDFSSYSINCLT